MIDSSADQPLDPPASKPATHPSAGDDSARGKPSHAPTHRCCDFSHGGAGLTVGGGGRGEGGGERLVGEHPHTRADSCCDSNQGGKGLVGGGGGSGGEGERLVGEHPQARADSCCDSNQESKGLIGGGEEGGEGRSGGEGRGETLSNNAIRDGGGGVVERGDLPMNPMSDSGGGDGSSSTVMVSGGNPPPSSSGNDAGDGGSSSSPSSSSRPVSRQWSSTMLQSISEEDVLHLMEGRDLQAIMGDMPPCQCDDCLMNGEEGVVHKPIRPSLKRQSSWKKIRSIVRWSPFIQVFKKHRYPWIQLAGHQGNFQAGEAGCVLKKLDQRELQSLQKLMTDCLQPFVPQFRGMEERGGTQYLQLQDLLCEFSCPSVMDVKMGVRTFLEAEIMAAKHSPTLRKDMYKKMTEVNPDAPSAEEHAQGAVTKHRYMQWRDQMSSSADLGFRIEGIKSGDGSSSKDFKTTKSRDSVAGAFRAFCGGSKTLLAGYLQRLQDIIATQETSQFFRSHEVIGSSLLFVHDTAGAVGVWMIDFGKTQPLPAEVSINHRAPWREGSHEDGYLSGLDNIIEILQDLVAASGE